MLNSGSKWPILPISTPDRLAKNKELIRRGNHKSALKYSEELRLTLEKEIAQGWIIPLPLSYISSLRNGELAPVGMDDKQYTVQPDGSKQVKLRLTHDQSFNTSHGKSVNDRAVSEELAPLYYGGCLSRIIHYIISIRLRHPAVKILGGKSDIKAAYRRINLHGDTAELSSIMMEDFGLPSLRLTFGGSPCPNEYCVSAELCTDLANDILHCKNWNPEKTKSPHASKIQPTKYLDESVPYSQAKELDVEIPPDDHGRVDDFIDDSIVIAPDINENSGRALQALLLAIHILFRPLDPKEKIKREDCLSLGKLQEEGFLSETPTILGWVINTRLLTISLPNKKYDSWNRDLLEVIKSKKISYKNLEQLLGRLNHAATACSLMRYYLNRLRNTLTNWQVTGHTKTVKRYLSSPVLEDLKLWQRSFLPKIKVGMSLNLTSFRRPTVISWSDACPSGLGGFDSLGNAWQFKLSLEDSIACKNQNNSLEFVAALITVWLGTKCNWLESEACFLAFCDNSSAVSWLYKASVDETRNLPLHLAARKYADVLLQAGCCLYSQHIPGQKNVVADLLSRNFTHSNSQLTTFVLETFPSQVPPSFTVSPLPQEILSWLTSWLQRCREKMGLQKILEIKKQEYGDGGTSTQDASTSTTMFGWKNSPQRVGPQFSEHLQQRSVDDSFPDQMRQTWLRQQCRRPLQNWVRFLGQTWGTTPHMSQGLKSCTHPYQDSLEG